MTYDSGICFRRNSRVLWTKSIDNSPQAKIDRSSHESRRDSKTHDLYQEAVLSPLVLVTLDTSNVTNDFEDHTADHSKMEGESSTGNSIGCEEADQGDGKEREEGGVCTQGDTVEVV